MKKRKNYNLEIDMFIGLALPFIYFIIIVISTEQLSNYKINYLLPIINLLMIIISILGIIIPKINYKKRILKKEIQNYEYYRDLNFLNINPTISGIILKKENKNINTIITSLFELAEKNIINIEVKENKNYISLKEHDNNILKNLLEYEKEILYLIFENSKDTKEYCLNDIITNAKKDSTIAYAFKKILKHIDIYINKKFYINFKDYLSKPNIPISTKLGSLIILQVGFGYIPLLTSFFNNINSISILIFIEYIISIILLTYYIKNKELKLEYYEEIQKLNGLYNYLEDFSNLQNKESKFYQLYDKYYLYAMGFGLTNKFKNELKQNILNDNIRLAIQFYIQNEGELEK